MSRPCNFCFDRGFVEVRHPEDGRPVRRPCPECEVPNRYDYEYNKSRKAEEEYHYRKKMEQLNRMHPQYFVDDPSVNYYPYETQTKQPPKQKEKGMNYSTAVMLINEEIRVISTSYEVEPEKPQDHHISSRTLFKTLDKTVKVGDYVVVPTDTRHKMTVAKVEEVDVDVNFESEVQVKWAIGKVDTKTVNDIKSKEGEWVAELKKVERKHQKDKLKEKILGTYAIDDLKVLSFTGQHDASVLTIDSKPLPAADNTTQK